MIRESGGVRAAVLQLQHYYLYHTPLHHFGRVV